MARARKKPAKAKAKAKAKARPAKAKAKRATAKTKPAKAKTAKARAKPVRRGVAAPPVQGAIPEPIVDDTSQGSGLTATGRRRAKTAREWSTRSSPVVEILDDPHPIGALRRFLDSLRGPTTEQQAQIALGAAQLMLLPIAREHRGGHEVKELVDLVLERWDDFGERKVGFHAQEFLRNAFAAIGVDRPRIARLIALVPAGAHTELLFNLACAHAVARDKVEMLRAIEAAVEAGATAAQFRRDADFAPYAADPDFLMLLAHADVPAIPVDVDPHVPAVRRAIDSLVATLRELGMRVELRPPVRLDAILDAERARKISLPNDYRALLTVTNGMNVWDHEFFGAGDYREATKLALRARAALPEDATECVPLASWDQPTDWLLYDPRGRTRGGAPGYVLALGEAREPVADLVTALARIEATARDVLGTN